MMNDKELQKRVEMLESDIITTYEFNKQLREENSRLKEQIEELKKENKHFLEEYEILGEEWSKLLDDKIRYSQLIQKYKKVVELLENKLEIFVEFKNGFEEDYYFVKCWQQDMPLTKEEYELLKKVLGDDEV